MGASSRRNRPDSDSCVVELDSDWSYCRRRSVKRECATGASCSATSRSHPRFPQSKKWRIALSLDDSGSEITDRYLAVGNLSLDNQFRLHDIYVGAKNINCHVFLGPANGTEGQTGSVITRCRTATGYWASRLSTVSTNRAWLS